MDEAQQLAVSGKIFPLQAAIFVAGGDSGTKSGEFVPEAVPVHPNTKKVWPAYPQSQTIYVPKSMTKENFWKLHGL